MSLFFDFGGSRFVQNQTKNFYEVKVTCFYEVKVFGRPVTPFGTPYSLIAIMMRR